MIAVIVPFARPQMTSNVSANFWRQQLPEVAALVTVENGPAIGTARVPGYIVQSEPGRSHARTAGLHKARELGAEWFAFWDDDDYYAPSFLEFMWAQRDFADVIGLCSYVEQDPTGKRWIIGADASDGLLVPECPGGFGGGVATPTLFGSVERALDWEAHVPWGEELFWHREMAVAGRTLYGLREPEPSNPLYVYVKHADPTHGHAIADWQRELKDCNAVALTA